MPDTTLPDSSTSMDVAPARRSRAFRAAWVAVFVLLSAIVAMTPARAAHTGLAPDDVRRDLPVAVDGEVLAFTQIGDRILVGGTFTQIRASIGAPTIDQPYLYAFDIDTGALDTTFAPVLDRPVHALVTDEADSGVFIGGAFTRVDDVVRRKVARLHPDGSLDTGFRANFSANVNAIDRRGDVLYVGGQFKFVNGVSRNHLAAVDTTTGDVDPTFDLPLTEGVSVGGWLDVKALHVVPDTAAVFVAHSARRIAGELRTAVALLDVSGDTASVAPWSSTFYEDALPDVGGALRITDAAVSPDGAYAVVTSGGGDRPPSNDTAVRFDLTSGPDTEPDWVSRHFDSVYSVAISESAVYTGGHFRYQEAPGSAEPYPGDPNENYGWGGDSNGAAVLGDEVVFREQVGALDPATGKALPWAPGANGQEGVLALEVIPRGLLLGHDGNVVDGHPVGRAGFFDFDATPVVSDAPVASFTAPLPGQTLSDGAFTVTGEAEAANGVDRVLIEVQDRVSRQYLRPDGTFGSWAGLETVLADPGATTTTWSLPIDLPPAGYVVRARAFGVDGQRQTPKPVVRFDVADADATPPQTEYLLPEANEAEFASNTITFSGTAFSPIGVQTVQFAAYSDSAGAWLQGDGSFGDYFGFEATVTTAGQTSVDWSITLDLPNGNWDTQARAVDLEGTPDPGWARRSFSVYPGNEPPTIVLDGAGDDVLLEGDSFTVSGTASDDLGVQRVLLRVEDVRPQQGLQENGFFGFNPRWFQVQVDDIGATTTTWSYTTPSMPYGRYRVRAYALDVAEVRSDAPWPERDVTLGVIGDELPVTQILTPDNNQFTFADNDLSITGTATDDVGVDRVAVRIWSVTAKQWVRADGSLGAIELIEATVDAPGATSVSWALPTLTVPDGRYRIDALAYDTVGQHDVTTNWGADLRNAYVFPGDALPQATMLNPVEDQQISGDVIGVGGEITDDESVQRVQIWIRNTETGQGPRKDGSVGVAQWVDGFVTNPDRDRSNVQYTSPALPPGTYVVRMRAIDDTGRWGPYVQVRVDLLG